MKMMELGLFLVTTLLSVHAFAQPQTESSTVAGFDMTTTVQQESFDKNITLTTLKDVTEEQTSTTKMPVNSVSDQTSPSITQNETSSVSDVDSIVTKKTTEEMTSKAVASTTQFYKTTNLADEETNSLSTKGEVSSSQTSTEKTIYQIENQTTPFKDDIQVDVTSTVSISEKTTTIPSPEQFFQWLDSIHRDNSTESDVTEDQTTTIKDDGQVVVASTRSILEDTTTVPSPEQFIQWLDSIHRDNLTESDVTEGEGRNNQSVQNEESTDLKNKKDGHWNRIPPREFMEWLDSIHPDSNATATKNIIDTSIISTEKLIIVISTICGTFVLFVAILIAISCCKRNRNIRNDSEKSDFSMTSVVSIPEKRKSDGFSTDKNGFNNLFMGIPANNEVWKNLEQLSPAAPSVMPESTKM